jgi:predicted RNA-binding protein with PIN domain
MALIIDGHNLIPKAGISLADLDDEAQLIHLLQEFCRLQRKTVEVYFDRAPAGYSGEQRHGQVRAVFVRSGMTADEAIMARLQQLGKRARQAQVVSSDRQVQQAARAVHAAVISSEEFARGLQVLADETPELDPRNRLLSEEEMAEWESLFRKGRGNPKS